MRDQYKVLAQKYEQVQEALPIRAKGIPNSARLLVNDVLDFNKEEIKTGPRPDTWQFVDWFSKFYRNQLGAFFNKVTIDVIYQDLVLAEIVNTKSLFSSSYWNGESGVKAREVVSKDIYKKYESWVNTREQLQKGSEEAGFDLDV